MKKEIVTYTLFGNKDTDDVYYETVEKLSCLLCTEMEKQIGDYVTSYREWIEHKQLEPIRSSEEYGLELLALGVYYQDYKDIIIKQGVSFEQLKSSTDNIMGNLRDLELLMNYLEGTGEYKEEILRLQPWLEYGKKLDSKIVDELFKRIGNLTEYLKKTGKDYLEQYVPFVESYRNKVLAENPARNDIGLVARKRLEYYLNMIGSQIMNHVYQEEFISSHKRYVFLPGCMTYLEKNGCKAVKSGIGYICTGCSQECEVNQVTKLIQDAKTLVVYHESQIQRTEFTEEKIGIVGIACVPSLLSGGWKARRMGYIPQCVLLDYCGCSQHWSKKRIITSISVKRLQKVLAGC